MGPAGDDHHGEGRQAVREQARRAVRAELRRHRRLGHTARDADYPGRVGEGPDHRQPPYAEPERKYLQLSLCTSCSRL